MNQTKKKQAKIYLNAFLFMLPALFLFCAVLIAPIVMSVYYSFFDWNGMGAKEFVGLSNYIELFSSKAIGFFKALGNSMVLAGFSVFLQLPLSLFLALMLGKGIKGERAFLSIFFIPVLISTVVIGQLFLKIYNPDYGVLNVILRNLHLEEPIAKLFGNGNIGKTIWLGNKKTALLCCFVPTLWQYVGYHMLLMYAGVKSVPPELREAAKLDGATDGQVDRFIVIPYMKSIIKVSVIFAVTGSLKSFDLIYVLTNGGPLHATEVPSTLMINMLFLRNRYGMGSAIAVMLILLCFAFALLISWIFKEED